MRHYILPTALLLTMGGCSDVDSHDHDHHHHDHNHGIPTTLDLIIQADDASEPLTFRWTDPENDGDPIIDPIVLTDGSDTEDHAPKTYSVSVRIYADLEEETEDLTPEIDEDAAFHQMHILQE